MGVLVYLICIAAASFAVLAQPAGAQGTNTTLPLIYPAQVLQGDDSQTCPSETQRERVKNDVEDAMQSLLQELVAPLLHNFSCGGSTGWRRVAYLDMSDPSQQCPSVWREHTTPHRVCGRRSYTNPPVGVTYTTGSVQYDQVCGRIIGYRLGPPSSFLGSSQSINTMLMELVSHMDPPANTSGPLLLVIVRGDSMIELHYTPALLEVLMKIIFHHLSARTTSVSQA